jgi:hypothetical protein
MNSGPGGEKPRKRKWVASGNGERRLVLVKLRGKKWQCKKRGTFCCLPNSTINFDTIQSFPAELVGRLTHEGFDLATARTVCGSCERKVCNHTFGESSALAPEPTLGLLSSASSVGAPVLTGPVVSHFAPPTDFEMDLALQMYEDSKVAIQGKPEELISEHSSSSSSEEEEEASSSEENEESDEEMVEETETEMELKNVKVQSQLPQGIIFVKNDSKFDVASLEGPNNHQNEEDQFDPDEDEEEYHLDDEVIVVAATSLESVLARQARDKIIESSPTFYQGEPVLLGKAIPSLVFNYPTPLELAEQGNFDPRDHLMASAEGKLSCVDPQLRFLLPLASKCLVSPAWPD